jgi:hypothetical protein
LVVVVAGQKAAHQIMVAQVDQVVAHHIMVLVVQLQVVKDMLVVLGVAWEVFTHVAAVGAQVARVSHHYPALVVRAIMQAQEDQEPM